MPLSANRCSFKRQVKRPRLQRCDRLFWMSLRTIWANWKSALMVVRPETVISWQRRRFKRYWWRLSQPKVPGRPRVSSDIRKLVRTMAAANPLWGAPRVHGELLKLGFEISERTVSRLMPKRERKPSQTWMTFLRNHIGQLVSSDFFTVSTIQLQVLYVLVSWRTTVAASCMSILQSIRPRSGRRSKWWTRFLRTVHHDISYEIETEFTGTTSLLELKVWASSRFGYRQEVHGKIVTWNV
jgi:hypothetical protein